MHLTTVSSTTNLVQSFSAVRALSGAGLGAGLLKALLRPCAENPAQAVRRQALTRKLLHPLPCTSLLENSTELSSQPVALEFRASVCEAACCVHTRTLGAKQGKRSSSR